MFRVDKTTTSCRSTSNRKSSLKVDKCHSNGQSVGPWWHLIILLNNVYTGRYVVTTTCRMRGKWKHTTSVYDHKRNQVSRCCYSSLKPPPPHCSIQLSSLNEVCINLNCKAEQIVSNITRIIRFPFCAIHHVLKLYQVYYSFCWSWKMWKGLWLCLMEMNFTIGNLGSSRYSGWCHFGLRPWHRKKRRNVLHPPDSPLRNAYCPWTTD